MQSPWKTAWGAWRASTCQNRRADRLNGSPQVAQGTSSTRPATQPRAPPCPERGRALEFAHPTLFPMIALMFTRDITSVHKLPPRAGVLGPSGSQPDANEMSNGQMEGTFYKMYLSHHWVSFQMFQLPWRTSRVPASLPLVWGARAGQGRKPQRSQRQRPGRCQDQGGTDGPKKAST